MDLEFSSLHGNRISFRFSFLDLEAVAGPFMLSCTLKMWFVLGNPLIEMGNTSHLVQRLGIKVPQHYLAYIYHLVIVTLS
jgi:hypothetical protein